MTLDFVYTAQPARIVFAPGSARYLSREVDLLGARRVLVLCTPEQRGQAEEIAHPLGGSCVGLFDKARMHVPVELVDEAESLAMRSEVELTLAIGGGSAIGLAKMLALRRGLPIIAVATTYAGSEVTPIHGSTQQERKVTGRDARVLPRTVLYDPLQTLGLPVALSVSSGFNAIAHAAEGLYASDANPVMSLIAEEGIRAMATALPEIVRNPADTGARTNALYGAWLCGSVLGNVGMALHHKLCHTLGGSFDLPHAAVHAVMLPHVLAFNATAAPDAMSRIARAIRAPDACGGLFDLLRRTGAPTSLRELGMPRDRLGEAALNAASNAYWNPRAATARDIEAILERAWAGAEPNG